MNNDQDFLLHKFNNNNLRILVISIFLVFEQVIYALFIRDPGSILQRIHLFSSGILFIYLITSIYFIVNRPNHINFLHKIYEICFPIFGFLIVVIRTLIEQQNIFHLPLIFIAIYYGFAAIFYFCPLSSLVIYFVTSLSVVYLLPIVNSNLVTNTYVIDIISNALLALLISIINYNKFTKEYNYIKTIEKKNYELKTKTIEIQGINEKLVDISEKDKLTDIFNRRKLENILEHLLLDAKADAKTLSIILLDIDDFKSVNDLYGHIIGDEILIEMADILKKNIRNVDIIGRWGGEEFLIICPHSHEDKTIDLSKRLKKIIENNKFSFIDSKSCSFGIATYKEHDDIKSIIDRADRGLYKAKEKGKNRIEVGYD